MTKEKSTVPRLRFPGFTDAWKQRKLGEVAISFDYGLNSAATEYDGENKYLRITDIDDDSREFNISNLTSPEINLFGLDEYRLSIGDILFARTGASVGKSYIYRSVDGKVYFAGFLIRVKIKDTFNPDFVFQNTLTSNYERFISITSMRSGQPGVNAQEYSNYEIMFPTLPEQEAIGSFFSDLDQLITLHQRKLDDVKELKKALLQKMFPKGNGNDFPELRFPEFTDAWKQRKLGEVGSTYTGLSGKTKDDFGHGDGRFVTYMNVFSNSVSSEDMLGLIEIDEKQNRVLWGDVFFTTSSETPEDVGLSSVWLGQADNIYLNSFCFGFRPKIKINPYYLAYMLRSPIVRRKIVFLAQGISRYNISKNKLMELEISLPALPEQEVIGSFFSDLDQLITLHQRQLDHLKLLKKALLQQMFI
ncbi:restriction endonuclease subunit S [Streptococcus suis]|uniref:restriction endonuclease subunit S n=1 Tax=Streptococcus suis TaxID=1307 RepID=UPI00211D2722|nr:restriction endonuclease subunit S [Streptococcus suis]UUM57488.1 restriction endonuclease subunit S [Streptococcus suis]